MHSNRALRATLISIIFFLSSLLPALIIVPTIGAESTGGTTTLYFHDFFETEGLMDENPPTKNNDSQWPPRVTDWENWLYWFSVVAISFMINESELDFDPFTSLFLDPYTVMGIYTNEGNGSLVVDGDVVFDLYFNSPRSSELFRNDKVQASLLWFDFDFESWLEDPNATEDIFKERNVTTRLTPSLLAGNIQNYKMTIENVNFSLFPEMFLIFSVKVIPGNKPLGWLTARESWRSKIMGLFPRFKEWIDSKKLGFINWTLNRANSSKFELARIASQAIQVIREAVQMQNITKEDVAEILNGMRSSSVVYDSINHPSSVSVPFTLPGEDENKYVYYLHDGNKMYEEEPTKDTPSDVELSKGSAKWVGPDLERSKILKKATANIYIGHRDLYRLLNMGKIKLVAKLTSSEGEIATSEKELSKNWYVFNTIRQPEPITFIFEGLEDEEDEITYDDHLSLEVSASNGTKFGPLGLRSAVKLLYDSTEYPSSLTVKFDETDHIKLDVAADPSDEKIVPGDSVKYTLNITSRNDDEVTINVLENKEGDWEVTIVEDKIDISAGGTAKAYIFVNSTNNKKKAYGDFIDLTFVASGKTGISRRKTLAEVSEDAIEYDVDIVKYTESKNIKKGNNGTFYFIIENKNTGADDDVDSYTIAATSENNWEIKHTESIKNLGINNKTGPYEILVVVSVPKNTSLKSDTITFTVTSDSNIEAFAVVNVTVDVIGPTFFESIYEFFKSTSNSLGLEDMFGDYAPVALAAIFMIIILFVIIMLALLLTRKFVNIICTERIREIDSDDKATFEITLENPTRKTKTYEISSADNPSSAKWEKSLDKEKMSIDGRQSKTVFLLVKPTEVAEPNDWIETKVKVNVLGKRKSEEITTMSMIKDGKTLLKITDVFTWPKDFTKGDRVTTSFKLENKGNITARNVNVILYINGREKNKTVVTIPSGGYADIRMPWTAYKGKNKLYVKAREQ